ncbi:MAG: TetR/AcrR family transcriptional regulator [Lachnospiraceae bacterium]|nr:TetR/AcrR family transcriptional regulator [Lachnospiraceae bacterium]
MAKVTMEESERVRRHILHVGAKNFLKSGFTNTTVRKITTEAGVSVGCFNCHYRTKEDLLYDLVTFVLGQQFSVSEKLTEGRTDDKILLYAAETTLQLHIVEMNENLRDVYSAAYSLPKTSELIQQTVTGKMEHIFKEQLPQLETKDFYLLEIATGGIMRGFMTVRCNIWFSMDMKVRAFLENTLRLYRVPEEKIEEAVAFVKQFDFKKIAEETIAGIFRYLEEGEVG